jgi:Glycogen recognition site of AMP-activated protein kinase
MGNNPSKSPSGDSPAPTAASPPAPSNERRVNRRLSVHAPSGVKATAADPSASRESATWQSVPQSQTPVQQRLQSRTTPHPAHRPLDGQDRRDAKRPDARSRDIPSLDVSSPVQVPSSIRSSARRAPGLSIAPSGPPSSYSTLSHLQRPPRLPLPIVDATATPGSPAIAPADSLVGSLPYEKPDHLTIRDAAEQNTSVDEDEVEDELQSYAMAGVGKAVPTTIEWKKSGERVYVTGTFVNWEKKFRLHRRYVIPLPTRNHHSCSYVLYEAGKREDISVL